MGGCEFTQQREKGSLRKLIRTEIHFCVFAAICQEDDVAMIQHQVDLETGGNKLRFFLFLFLFSFSNKTLCVCLSQREEEVSAIITLREGMTKERLTSKASWKRCVCGGVLLSSLQSLSLRNLASVRTSVFIDTQVVQGCFVALLSLPSCGGVRKTDSLQVLASVYAVRRVCTMVMSVVFHWSKIFSWPVNE